MFKKCIWAKKIFMILLAFLIINGQVVASARAGGGGGGSSGGSGGGGPSSSSGDTSYSSSLDHGRTSRGRSDPLGYLMGLALFSIVSSVGTITYRIKLSKKKSKGISAVKALAKKDKSWNYKKLKKDIEDAFYEIQNAWMERNQDLAKKYMSENLYIKHKCQTEWMIIRKEKNILKNINLIGAKPIGVQNYEGINNDSVWVHIRARSIDYTINEETKEVINGKKYIPTYYEEYWKFIKSDVRWVLDEIRQLEDIDDLDFFKIDV